MLYRRMWSTNVERLRTAQRTDAGRLDLHRGLAPYVYQATIASLAVAMKHCKVKNSSWMDGNRCEVNSVTNKGKWFSINLTITTDVDGRVLPVDRALLCSNGCNEARTGLCPHVLAALRDRPCPGDKRWVSFVAPYMRLSSWAAQLCVDVAPPANASEDMRQWPMPTHAEIVIGMQAPEIVQGVLAPDKSVKGKLGRPVGSLEKKTQEAKKARAKALAEDPLAEVGVEPLSNARGVHSMGGAPGHHKQCQECTHKQGRTIFIRVDVPPFDGCGGPKNKGGPHSGRVGNAAWHLDELSRKEGHNERRRISLQVRPVPAHHVRVRLAHPCSPELTASHTDACTATTCRSTSKARTSGNCSGGGDCNGESAPDGARHTTRGSWCGATTPDSGSTAL